MAEELVQETFLRVFRARQRHRADARFSTWLYTIAGNAARNALRRPFRCSVHEQMRQRLERFGALPLDEQAALIERPFPDRTPQERARILERMRWAGERTR